MKTQTIRLLDVALVGPVMIYGGLKLREDRPLLGWGLMLLGGMTIGYNGSNYLRLRRKK